MVTECTAANLLMLKDGAVRTAPADGKIIPGVTRNHFLQLARENGIPVFEEAFTVQEAMDADELLITSTSVHGVRVVEIDGTPVCGRDLALGRAAAAAVPRLFLEVRRPGRPPVTPPALHAPAAPAGAVFIFIKL